MSFTLDDMTKAGRTTIRGVRLWDREGLLGAVARDGLNRRVFTAEHMRRARIIAAAQTAGWPNARIRAYFSAPSDVEQHNLCSDLFSATGFIHDVRAMLESNGKAVFDL